MSIIQTINEGLKKTTMKNKKKPVLFYIFSTIWTVVLIVYLVSSFIVFISPDTLLGRCTEIKNGQVAEKCITILIFNTGPIGSIAFLSNAFVWKNTFNSALSRIGIIAILLLLYSLIAFGLFYQLWLIFIRKKTKWHQRIGGVFVLLFIWYGIGAFTCAIII